MKKIIDADEPQYKANLHCHSTLSDGKLTPEQLKEAYKSHGYSVLSITDHERPADHSDLTDKDFLMLTGYEVYIRPGNRYDRFGKEIHMNLFARDPHNIGAIAYDPSVARYTPEEEKQHVLCLGSNEQRMYTPGYINRVVRRAKENGYIVSYNHPYWSHEELEDVLRYTGFFSMEMCNYSSYVGNMLEYNAQMYDSLLRNEVRIACHSADDNHNTQPFDHPLNDSFGGFTMILADRLEYDCIFNALENGSFYSSMGPMIYDVTMDGRKIYVKSSDAQRISMYIGAKMPLTVVADNGKSICEAEFELPERAQFFRVSVLDDKHRFADTRGYFVEDWDISE